MTGILWEVGEEEGEEGEVGEAGMGAWGLWVGDRVWET